MPYFYAMNTKEARVKKKKKLGVALLNLERTRFPIYGNKAILLLEVFFIFFLYYLKIDVVLKLLFNL